MNSLTPRRVFRALAWAEAATWALLLVAMLVKYGTEAESLGELAVSAFGLVHGVVFIAYCLVVLLVAVDQRWSPGRVIVGLAAAVPPFATLLFEAYADRRNLLGTAWLSRPDSRTAPQRTVCWLLSHHRLAVPFGVLTVIALTSGALAVGPPTG